MTDEKSSRKELEARLSKAETAVKAIREEKIDALIGKKGVYLLRLKEMEEALEAEHGRLVKVRTISSTGPRRTRIAGAGAHLRA